MGNRSTGAGGSGMTRLGTRFVPISALKHVLFDGKPIAHSFTGDDARGHGIRKDRLRKLFVKGARAVASSAGPVVVIVTRSGKMIVDSGRHRIEVAREKAFRKQKLLVRFVRGSY
jgi:hypothetical protein